jgi:hypothetical protein
MNGLLLADKRLSTRGATLIRLSFPPTPIGSYRSLSENSDNRPLDFIEFSYNSQASDEGSIPFTRSMISWWINCVTLLIRTAHIESLYG